MNYYEIILWAAVLIIALVCEFMTMELVSVWFMPGATVAMILALFGVPLWVQIVVFIVLSFALLAAIRPFAARLLKKDKSKTNLDLIVGSVAVVTKPIGKGETGGVIRKGIEWSAESVGGEIIETGVKVIITAIEGNKLIVKKGE